ncbi:MAG: hypothetical protein NXI27_07800 [Alphaproteobacteria bacterium]|nr:hypothetical protein [Alphaproteobacteria bacterium]
MTEKADEDAIRQAVAFRIFEFSDWENAGGHDHFGPGEMVAIALAYCVGLQQLNSSLDTAESLVNRALALYRWIRPPKPDPMDEEATAPLTTREKLLAALVDAHIDGGKALRDDRLAARLGIDREACTAALVGLAELGLVQKQADGWRFRRN